MPIRLAEHRSRPGCRSATSTTSPTMLDETTSSRRRSATRSWSRSRSASSAASRRGTTRCTRSPRRSPPRWPPAAPSCSSPARSRRSTPSSWPRSSTRSACPPACSTWSSGVGPVVGEAIAAHPDVDMVSFTGSTRAGKRVSERRRRDGQAGRPRTGRQVGQHHPRRRRPSPTRCPSGVFACYLNSGQTCTRPHPHAGARASSRTRSSSSPKAAAEATAGRRPVRPEGRMLGPLDLRRRSTIGYGATSRRASTRGPRSSPVALEPPEGLDTGYFVRADGVRRRRPPT